MSGLIMRYESICRENEVWTLPGTPFSVLLLCDHASVQEDIGRQCETLIRAGCAFFAAVGKHHLQWHLAFDEANLRHSPDLEDEKAITTVSHETLDLDSVEEWVLTSEHPLADIDQGILLYENKSQLEIVEGFLHRAFQQAGDGIHDNQPGT